MRYDALILGTTGLFCLALIWEISSRLNWMDPVLISSPTRVATSLKEWAVSGSLWQDLGVSLFEIFVGFGLATIVGVGLGVAMGWKRLLEYAFDPFIWILYATPLISLWPLFIIWLGIGIKPFRLEQDKGTVFQFL